MIKVLSIATSRKKGTRKEQVPEIELVADHGLKGDAHAGPGHRQVSFLAQESIARMQAKGLAVGFGDFAENFATEGIDWTKVPVGTRVLIGETALVEITQIGKECHRKCAIYYQAGDCVMPTDGVFARVLKGGKVREGDPIRILTDTDDSQAIV